MIPYHSCRLRTGLRQNIWKNLRFSTIENLFFFTSQELLRVSLAILVTTNGNLLYYDSCQTMQLKWCSTNRRESTPWFNWSNSIVTQRAKCASEKLRIQFVSNAKHWIKLISAALALPWHWHQSALFLTRSFHFIQVTDWVWKFSSNQYRNVLCHSRKFLSITHTSNWRLSLTMDRVEW